MRSLKPVLILVVVIGLGVVAWRLTRPASVPRDVLSASGTIEATEVDVSAKVAGKAIALPVNEGDQVAAGDPVATLDSEELAAQVDQATAAVAAAEANLAELRAGTRSEDRRRAQAQYDAARRVLEQARAQRDLVNRGPRAEQIAQVRAALRQAEAGLADAETELRRAQKLESEGALARQQVDLAGTRREVAAAQVEQARQRLAEAQAGARPEERRAAQAVVDQAADQARAAQATRDLAVAGPRAETIAAAQARTEQARGVLRAAQAQQGYTEVRAPVKGTVTLRSVELGELVTPGLPIVRLADLDRVWIRVYIPEVELGRVKLGQRAEIITDTYPGKRYPGKVIEIAQEPEFTPKNVQTKEERVKLVFGIKIEVANPAHELKPGMPADAVIHVGPPIASPAAATRG
jgi:HlyD family secretion protein